MNVRIGFLLGFVPYEKNGRSSIEKNEPIFLSRSFQHRVESSYF